MITELIKIRIARKDDSGDVWSILSTIKTADYFDTARFLIFEQHTSAEVGKLLVRGNRHANRASYTEDNVPQKDRAKLHFNMTNLLKQARKDKAGHVFVFDECYGMWFARVWDDDHKDWHNWHLLQRIVSELNNKRRNGR